jgi:hypothetical protein
MISLQSFKFKKTNQKGSFKEIYDFKANNFDNIRFSVKITRVFIRYSIRNLGYEKGILYLIFFLKLCNFLKSFIDLGYIIYILEINIYKIKCLIQLYNLDIQGSVSYKIKWAEYTIKNSKSLKSRTNAKVYLSLLAKNGFYRNHYRKIVTLNRKVLKNPTNNLFYIYGPNSQNPPNKEYKDYTIVLMKPVDFDLSIFSKKILYVNGNYYNEAMYKNDDYVHELLNKYDRVIVSSLSTVLDERLERAKFPISDNISAPMALGRLLYNLIFSYDRPKCVIEGFDFYLDNQIIAKYYPTLAQKINGSIEQDICNSIAEHDGLYNFLYVKELSEYIELTDSIDLKNILSRSGQWYINKLQKVRDFSTLKNI